MKYCISIVYLIDMGILKNFADFFGTSFPFTIFCGGSKRAICFHYGFIVNLDGYVLCSCTLNVLHPVSVS